MTLSILSHIWVDGADQAITHSTIADNAQAHNIFGPLGAKIGELLFNEAIGIGIFSLIYLLFLLALLLLKRTERKLLSCLRTFILCTFWAIWLSLVATSMDHLCGYEGSLSWGGAQGEKLFRYIQGQIGSFGLALSIFFSLVVMLILSYDRVLLAVRDTKLSMPNAPQVSLPKPKGLWTRISSLWAKVSTEVEASDDEQEAVQGYEEEALPQGDRELQEAEEDEEITSEPSWAISSEEPVSPTIQDSPQPQDRATPTTSSPLANANGESSLIIEEALTDDLVSTSSNDAEPLPIGIELATYKKPEIELLREYELKNKAQSYEEVEHNKQLILETLNNFKIPVTIYKATIGPTVTLYELIPGPGVKLASIRNLADNIALGLKSSGIRILAPIPGTGTVGIEVPNSNPQIVSMRSILASRKYQEAKERMELPIGIGKTITNEPFVFDLSKMPHMLIAGSTGQGKSVGLNALITSLLYSKRPEELKLVLIDPKMLEFKNYSDIEAHFLAKLPDSDEAIITDMTRVMPTLLSLCAEMDTRYRMLSQAKVRNIKEYNEQVYSGRLRRIDGYEPLPYIVIIVDEFADLMMTVGREIELPLARLAQKARAAGIHIIIATQRPSADVITGIIKANFPARIAFRVTEMSNSRIILDSPGAEQLIGRGDMLFYQGLDLIRIQCAFMDTDETEAVVEHIAKQERPSQTFLLPEYVPEGGENSSKGLNPNEKDSLFEEVARMVVASGVSSASNIQRKFGIGYNRAGRITDQLEAAGIISAPDRSTKNRDVLIQDLDSLEHLLEQLR